MDDYPYCELGDDGWLRTDGLHRQGFPMLLWDALLRFGYEDAPIYRGRMYREHGLQRCEVHVDIPSNPVHSDWMEWSTWATGNDMEDTLERVAHLALTKFCERHFPDTAGTAIAMYPVHAQNDPAWSQRVKIVRDYKRPEYHAGFAQMTCYALHLYNLHQESITTSQKQRERMGELEKKHKNEERKTAELGREAQNWRKDAQAAERRIQDLDRELLSLYRRMDAHTQELDHTRTQLTNVRGDLTNATNTIAAMETDIHAIEEENEHLVQTLQELQLQQMQQAQPPPPPGPADDADAMSGIDDD